MKAKFLALAALVLGLASCQQEPELINPVGGEVDVVLTVDAQQLATRAAEDDGIAGLNSAYGAVDYFQATDWSKADLRYTMEVYDVKDGVVTNTKPVKARMTQVYDDYQPASFELRLVPGRDYRFVVFADFVANNSAANYNGYGLHHDITSLAAIKVINDSINDECTDAYFAFKDVTVNDATPLNMTLTRPYGKVRVIATDYAELNNNVYPGSVVVSYDAAHVVSFNAVTGAIDATQVSTTVEYTATLPGETKSDHIYTAGYDAEATHMTIFTDYILATSEQSTIHFTMDVKDTKGVTIKKTAFNTEIPVQRNNLTTIIGNVLTTATEVNVTIDDMFAGETVITAGFEEELAAAATQKNAVIDLTADIMWKTGSGHGTTPWIPADAITETLTINANGHRIVAQGDGIGAIRMANGGKLIINEAVIVDESVSYNEAAWELGYLEFAGKLEFNRCEFKSAVMMCGGTGNNDTPCEVTFNECRFNSNKTKEYAVWVSGLKAYFNSSIFEGPRGLKMHEAYGSEIAEVIVDDCTFQNIGEKPGIAIGTVNAATKVEIKNSTFVNCQPGDQGLYIYETDTDVTSFDFTLSNNSLSTAVSTQAQLDSLLSSNLKTIEVSLAADVDLTANDAYLKLGGVDTERIIIDGAKLSTATATGASTGNYTLNLATTYWSRINTVNPDAVVELHNLNLTSSQTSGTWNSYDVTFQCNVDLKNVNLLKAVAFDGEGKTVNVENVTITESHNYYAMWISAVGQTVNIKNLVVYAPSGRGIKIDEQYVGTPTLVTLNVENAKFTTAEKAAIIVKSAAGANITLADIDITAVAEDSSNEVWIDEDAASTINKVNVVGGSMVVEGVEPIEIGSIADLEAELEAAGAAGAGYTVLEITADIDMTGQAWTPIKVDGYHGADIVTIDGKGHTITGLTASLFAGGFAGGSGIVIKNLTIADSNIVADNTQGYGAFVNCADSMDVITLINCHLVNSSIITPNDGADESRIGGLIGWTAGYNKQNDGPVDSYITVQNCSVTGCTFKGFGSIGGICGHAGANAATYTTIENCTITNNTLISTDDGGWRVGVVVGTANNGQCVIKNITESGNTLQQVGKTAPEGEKRNYYGRFVPAGTGHLTIDDVAIQ